MSNTPCRFITGVAGSGKTFLMKQKVELEPEFGIVTASTGIASINIGSITINSLLKFYNLESIKDRLIDQKLQPIIRRLAQHYRNVIIDEMSMINGETLDILYRAFNQVNNYEGTEEPIGLILVGDFCLALGTKVMMADGSLKAIEKVKVGDQVMGPDSKPRNVLRTTSGIDQMYLIEQTNGDDYIVNSNHSLALIRSVNGNRLEEGSWKRYPDIPDKLTIKAKDLAGKSKKFRECFVGYKAGLINLPERSILIDPYFLGLWLGDGDKDGARITSADSEVLEYCNLYARRLGLNTRIQKWKERNAVRISLSRGRELGNKPSILRRFLRHYDLLNNKHIPEDYLLNSQSNRLQLLAGIIDSDGCWSGNRYTITLTLENLSNQVKQLADQLGFRTSIHEVSHGYYKYNANSRAWTITIGGDTWRIPCRIERKKSIPRNLGRSRLTSVLNITPIGVGNYAGFEIDGDHLFLLADGTVTHNCQLPPVQGKWAFEAECWEDFEANTTKLDKIYRQTDLTFLEALNQIRRGNAAEGYSLLEECKIDFVREVNTDIRDTTTIFAKNAQVDNFNFIRLQQLKGEKLLSYKEVEGKPLKEWDKITNPLELKIGAYVMILSNKASGYLEGIATGFEYVNGDSGVIKDYLPETDSFAVELVRNKQTVLIERIDRFNCQKQKPTPDEIERIKADYNFEPYYGATSPSPSNPEMRWISGIVNYHPLRLAYAATCHKVQGLTLDRIQLDIRNKWWELPGMVYVGLSRARSPQGLVIVGNETLMKKRVKTDPKLERFL